jgi:SAM-dependent methyltransferase
VILGEEVFEELGTAQAHLAAAWLPRVGRLLELGCSSGYLTRFFSGRAGRIVGVDLNARALGAARRRHPDVPVVCGDAERLPFADCSFDAVVGLEVIEHTASDTAAIAELHRVLRVGGTLILSTPHVGTFAFLDPHNLRRAVARRLPFVASGVDRFARYHNAQLTDNLNGHRHYRRDELTRLLEPRFAVRATYRGGLLLYPLMALGVSVAGRLWGSPRALRAMIRLLNWEYRRPFGGRSYNLMILAERMP